MLEESVLPVDPWALFAKWFACAKEAESSYPEAMILATGGGQAMPSARAVLMKGFDKEGIVFYTNRESHKGQQLKAHAKAAVCFYWKSLQSQIRLEGNVVFVSDAESDTYFLSRSRDSQIGAWASLQSRPLSCRAELENRCKEIEELYKGQDIPRPPYWGGYRLCPTYFEFWLERPHRLHDRIVYRKNMETWSTERLYP